MLYVPGSSYNHVTAEGFVSVPKKDRGPSLGTQDLSVPISFPVRRQDHCTLFCSWSPGPPSVFL